MRNVDTLDGLEHRSGNADMIRESNLRGAQAFADFGVQLAVSLVVQKERRSFRIEHSGNRADQLLEQRSKFDFRRRFGNNPEHLEFLLPFMLEFFRNPPALERRGGLPYDGFQQLQIFLAELA